MKAGCRLPKGASLLVPLLVACGSSPTGTDGDREDSFSGRVVVGTGGGDTIFAATLVTSDSGPFELSMESSLTAPGSGENAGRFPRLAASLSKRGQNVLLAEPDHLVREAGGLNLLVLTASIENGTYDLRIGWRDACGGCTLDYTIRIKHRGALRPEPPPICRQWILEFKATRPDEWVRPEIDLTSVPATARLVRGEQARVGIVGLDCLGHPGFDVRDWTSDPPIATIAPAGLAGDSAGVVALARGESRLSATVLTQGGTIETAGLAHCSRFDSTNRWCTAATPLVLVVR
jgi:hypothetical protein